MSYGKTVAMGDILALQGKAGGGAFSLGFSLGFLLFLCWSGMSVWHKEDILYLSLFFSLAAAMLLAAVGCRVGIYAGGAGRWKK